MDQSNLNDDDRPAQSCSDNGTHEREITDFTSVGDTSNGYCLSTLDSHSTAVCEQPDVMCQLTSEDALPVTADDLLHAVANSHVMAVRNSSRESCCRGNEHGDSPNTTANSPDCDLYSMSPGLQIGQVGFKARLRVNVETLAELELWQKDFAERSKTTMRYANVSICTGKKTLYKVNEMILCVDYLHAYFQHLWVAMHVLITRNAYCAEMKQVLN